MIDAGGRSGGPCWQPPRLRHKKIRADEGDQPDYDEQNEAHCARPPKWFPEPSPRSLPTIPKKKRREFKPGRIYHSFFSAQAASCIYSFLLLLLFFTNPSTSFLDRSANPYC